MDTLVRLNRQLRDEFVALNPKMMAEQPEWAQEFCTITCNIGRRSGKSEWIRRTATQDDLIVTMDQDIARMSYGPKHVATVLTARTLHRARTGWPFLPAGLPHQRDFRNIFVDEPHFVFEIVDMGEFYRLLATDPDQTFFFLGGQYA